MPSKSSIPDRAGWLQDANTMLVSLLCHLSLLILLALFSTVGSPGAKDKELVVHLGSGQDSAAAIDQLAPDESLADGEALGGGGAQLQETLKPIATFEPEAAVAPQQSLVESEFGAIAAPLEITPLEKPRLLSKIGGPAPGDGNGQAGGPARGGDGKGEGFSAKAATDFFGISGYGQTFVYVVDCSGSMNENGKFERARYELLHSIEQLNKNQRYFVIFYNHQTHPMEGDKPVFASPERIAKTTQWISLAEADGGTNPLPALTIALSMQPDAIYFLSDGQFDPNTIRLMRFRNRPNLRLKTKTIPIHSVAFYDRFAAGLMQTIAKNSGGEFRFVQ